MENISDISHLLIQAPLAVIMFFFIYLIEKQKDKLIDSMNKTNEKLIDVIKDLTKN